MRRIDRRTFLKGIGATAGLAGLGSAAAGCAGPSSSGMNRTEPHALTSPTHKPAKVPTISRDEIGLPVASWVVEENARPGTTKWLVRSVPHGVEGFASKVSATPGEEVTLYISSRGGKVAVDAYRMGWYQGTGARLVAHLGTAVKVSQPAPSFTPGINMVECHWAPSLSFHVGSDWPTGYYLLRIETTSGWSQWIPLVVRDDASRAKVLVQSSV
ncbi:MAG: N,N-dimethylformamidase beta subunit family domain-containing protein, partial [Acidimicrobiales bacterium]